MNTDKIENLICDLEEMIVCLEQYRLLTNKFINRNVSIYNIEKFIKEEYIKLNSGEMVDYEYDIFCFVSIKQLKEIVKVLKEIEDRCCGDIK